MPEPNPSSFAASFLPRRTISATRLVGVGKRRLEGHDRQEEVYVVQHPDIALEPAVAEDES
jgi:hypothetical protein